VVTAYGGPEMIKKSGFITAGAGPVSVDQLLKLWIG
jgi:hypothetical protein